MLRNGVPERRRWEGTTSRGLVVRAVEGETASPSRASFLGRDALGVVDVARERSRMGQHGRHHQGERASALFLASPAGMRLTAVRSEPSLVRPSSLCYDYNLGYRAPGPTLSYHQRRQREAEQLLLAEQSRPDQPRRNQRRLPRRRVVYVSHSFVHPPSGLTAAYVKHTDHVRDALVPLEACALRQR